MTPEVPSTYIGVMIIDLFLGTKVFMALFGSCKMFSSDQSPHKIFLAIFIMI